MTIRQLYSQYQIMSNLELHMFRVAGVAEQLGTQLLPADELHDVITACLLHDLGNLAKFDLEYFPDFVEPQGLAYWQQVQAEFWSKYGKNAHQATLQILAELGVTSRVVDLVNAVSFNKAKQTLDSTDFARKICAYADMRVAPYGVVSLEERLEDGRKRYSVPGKKDTFTYVLAAYIRKIEGQLFENIALQPADITDQTVQPLLAKYPDWIL